MPTKLGYPETCSLRLAGRPVHKLPSAWWAQALGRHGTVHFNIVNFMLRKFYLQQNKTGLWWASGHRTLLIKIHGTLRQRATSGSGKHTLWGTVRVAGMSKNNKMGRMKPQQEIFTLWATLPCGIGCHRITCDVLEKLPSVTGWLDRGSRWRLSLRKYWWQRQNELCLKLEQSLSITLLTSEDGSSVSEVGQDNLGIFFQSLDPTEFSSLDITFLTEAQSAVSPK